MLDKKEFDNKTKKFNEYRIEQLNKPNVMRRFFCAVGLHKWTFYSTEIEISKRDIHFGSRDYKIGEERKYEYVCTCCDFRKIKIKGYTYLGDYERWEKKTYV